jgi:hypothetical protein
MVSYDISVRISEIEKGIREIKKDIDQLMLKVKQDEDIWDNTDLIQNWHISERTLSGWRADMKITFSQVGKKIFYTKKDRDSFIEKYHVSINGDEFGKSN